jgi:hypothetical protein
MSLWSSLRFRVLASILVGAGLGLLLGEGVALLSDDPTNRPAHEIELLIPPGTSVLVAAGNPEPSIPQGLRLATGDSLVVRNLDTVSHQLGPMWVPAGTTARLVFPHTIAGQYTCSFNPQGYLGIQVETRLTPLERFAFLLVASLPFVTLLPLVTVFHWYSRRSPELSRPD